MEMMERYIYAVTRKLPQSQREDIGKELRGLIEDMLEERVLDGAVTEADVEEVLLELGDPQKLAEKYRGKKYFIGPELYDPYMMVMKITLVTVGIIIGASFLIRIMLEPPSILDSFISFIISIFTVMPAAFGWVTLTFACIQLAGEKEIEKAVQQTKAWTPKDLPPIPDSKGRIKKGEAITGIVFYLILIALFAFSGEYLGVWVFREGMQVVPFFNEAHFGYSLLLILLIFGSGIIKECLKLVYGRWTVKLVIFTAVVNIASIIGLLIIIVNPVLWNPDFMNQLTEAGVLQKGSGAYDVVGTIWEKITFWTLILFILGLVWDIVDGSIKVWKNR